MGARFKGHASFPTDASRIQSLSLPNVESALPTIEINFEPSLLINGKSTFISSVSPLLEIPITTSPFTSIPKSPCIPSAGCIKKAGVPVLANVAAIFLPIIPDFPIPITTTLPLQPKIILTA